MWGRNSVLSLSFLPQLINRKALSSPLSIYSFLPHEHHNSLYLIISSHSDFSGFWADAVIHHLVPPFRTEVLLLQLPRAVGSWQPRAEFPARTCTWLKELPHPGSQTFPEDSLYLVTGQCGGTKTWPPFFISRPLWRVMSDSELHSPPILNTAPPPISQGLCGNCITLQLLPLPSPAFLLSYRFCSTCEIQQTPASKFPSQGLSRTFFLGS